MLSPRVGQGFIGLVKGVFRSHRFGAKATGCASGVTWPPGWAELSRAMAARTSVAMWGRQRGGAYIAAGRPSEPLACSLARPSCIAGDLPAILARIGKAKMDLTTAVTFTAMLRNSVGHNLGWRVRFSKLACQKLFTMVAISNLHAIASLY